MIEVFFGLIIFVCLAGAAVYFLVIRPKLDKKQEVPAPAPVKITQREDGTFIGLGNPSPPDPNARPLWEFKFPPAHYGASIKASMGDAAPVMIAPNAEGRWDGPGGIVFKKGNRGLARLHDKFGSKATTCFIEFTV